MIAHWDVPAANVYTEDEAWAYANSLTDRKDRFTFWLWWWCLCGLLGYDQLERWNIWVEGECDCSSLIYDCLWRAGYLAKPTGSLWNYTLYTGSLGADLIAAGFTWHPATGNPEYADVVLNQGNHVCGCLGWGKVGQASIDERGRISGGQTGDQGNETNVRDYYWYSHGGWDGFWRPPDDAPVNPTPCPTGDEEAAGSGEAWRLYNPYTTEHLYTLDRNEYDALVALGWNGEGWMFTAPAEGENVYRLCNPYADPASPSAHHYTRSLEEAKQLWGEGWLFEGVPFYSGGDEPVWRVYNPYSGEHVFTPYEKELAQLVEWGWRAEGVGWYAEGAA